MFNKIQHKLLLTNPLLWNIRIVPVLTVAVLLHIIFFAVGYVDGAVDFTEVYSWGYGNSSLAVFFAVALAIILTIIWLVFYFRNNAYKSFYPITSSSLFKEWLLIFSVCLLNCGYSVSYLYAKDFKKRSYFSEQEFSKRLDVISMASVFAGYKYENNGNIRKIINGKTVVVTTDTFMCKYNNRQYSINSLLNKKIERFSYQNRTRDSLNDFRVKNWLIQNQRDSVRWVMQEFIKIANSHNLKSNITANEWLNLVYDYPEFTNYTKVGKIESYEYNRRDHIYGRQNTLLETNQYNQLELNTISNDIKVIGNTTFVYPKHYVPLIQIDKAYNNIARAYTSPNINLQSLLFSIYFALSLSLAIFSFRVTSGRSWLIALVSVGILALLTGVLSAILSLGSLYSLFWALIIIGALVYYYFNTYKSPSKKNTATVLNSLLWLLPWLIPAIYAFLTSLTYVNRYDSNIKEEYGILHWLDDNPTLVFYTNVLLFIVFMYFFTNIIKRWKGKPEA
ncbi:hypothetical protein [Flavobacterium litorale]|uniref:Uncharacterized protein n=1 Tax=Flavobacterium litorale TaxID=2856519 RepID=A0ABX8V5B5_9FLAO|nr:hypothetical protein [Flavobacterium litorale]QYJ68028.1 hypothetical protein K1I41_10900 [Flavobacterium litorale]